MTLLAVNWSALFANIGQFILAFSILVVLHELGHFLPAKWFGCRVDKFYLFFNPWFSLWKTQKGETEYGLGWVPLGGYVKIAGMIDESMDKEQLNQPAQPYEFRAKPAWQRLIIMLGGVTVNFILALILFAMILFVWGEEKLPVSGLRYGLMVDSLAQAAGLRNGDNITAINNEPVTYLEDVRKGVFFNETVRLSVKRNGSDTSVTLPKGFLSNLTKSQQLGFVAPRTPVIIKSDEGVRYVSGKLEPGDRLIGVNDRYFSFLDEYIEVKKPYRNQEITLSLLRNEKDTVKATVKTDEYARTMAPIKTFDELLPIEKRSTAF
jgi:regulator of sigma E protease